MSRWSSETFSGLRRFVAPGRLYRGPVIWIVVLLGGWLAISEWPAVASSVLNLTH